ncbi:MAG: menaquinone biosynthesis protein [bacterium]|nr:menaquinone biosynthesis protein [bacterium]
MMYRIATVSFLNCLPLVEWFTTPEGSARVVLSADLPSRLTAVLADDQADVALLPTAEILRGHAAGIIGGSGIACRGAVDSVKFYHRGPLADLRRVAVDRGSRTSVALLRILLAETAGVAPEFSEVEPAPGRLPGPGEGVLVIGDRCFAFDRWLREDAEARSALTPLDLGQAWFDHTGLPFVFAAWAAAPGFPGRAGPDGVRELGALLASARDWGLERVAALAAREAAAGCLGPGGEATPAALEYYFRHSLRYRLGAGELAGVHRFRDLCVAHGLVAPTTGPVLL